MCDVWQHEALCTQLWATAGAPPETQPKWGPVATPSATGATAAAEVGGTEAAMEADADSDDDEGAAYHARILNPS